MHRMFDERRYLIPFRATLLPQIFTDVLVIGGGVAGLRAALEVRQAGDSSGSSSQNSSGELDVIVALKGEIKQSNTYWAQGGISAVLDEADSVASHVQDTLTAGAGLCDESVVRSVCAAGAEQIDQLVKWGMRLDRAEPSGESHYALGREGGHSHHRIVHTDGDATGKALAKTLQATVMASEGVRLFDQCFVLDLVTVDGAPTRCAGAITHHPKHGLQVIWARAVILATGGAGQVYRESTNPHVATGDGLAMAYRAGAEVGDLAFMQFHPTTLYVAGASRSLITEAVRGEGAYLIDRNGQRFMPGVHELAELAPRDIVSRAIMDQAAATNFSHCYLDCRHFEPGQFASRFPGIHKRLLDFDIDPQESPIPIHPSAHYMIGGVHTDTAGRTSLEGLYAAGEVACTGLHGANRLASNSLLEGLVFGAAAARSAMQQIAEENGSGAGGGPVKIVSDIPISDRSELDLSDVRSSLRSVMWRHVGIEREGERLREVSEMFDFWARYTLDKIFDEAAGWEVQNLLWVGQLITRSALWRQESRGTHSRSDFPEPLDAFRVHDLWRRGRAEPKQLPVDKAVEAG